MSDSTARMAMLAEMHRRQQNHPGRSRKGALGATKATPPEDAPPLADRLRRDDVRMLLEAPPAHRVSIYMPLLAPGSGGEQNPIRLKNLLRKAHQQLLDHGLDETAVRALLKPAQALVTQPAFWRQSEGGLGLLLGPQVFRCYRLSHAPAEQLHVGRRFAIRPLLSLLDEDNRYWLLTVSQNAVRLYKGDPHGLTSVDASELPTNLAAALNLDMSQEGGQLHSATNTGHGNKQAAVFHGQGGSVETRKDELTQYFRVIDAALSSALPGERAPLVVGCVDFEFPLFRAACHYGNLLPEPLTGNVDHLGVSELHARAWPLVAPKLHAGRRAAAERCARLLPAGKATHHLTEIIPAAVEGRVDTLFVAEDAAIWGIYSAEKNAVDAHARRRDGDDDLLELAAVETLLHGGTVYAGRISNLPGSAPATAIYRF